MNNLLQVGVGCPTEEGGFEFLKNVRGRITIYDIILSASAETTFGLRFAGEVSSQQILTLFLPKNGAVVSNFQGDVQSDPGQSIIATCGQQGFVTVTIVGRWREREIEE